MAEPTGITDDQLMGFLERIEPDFHRLRSQLVQLHPEWSAQELATNMMEFGRGQISEIEEPSSNDRRFIASYCNSLDLAASQSGFYCAYAGGCIMGLVQSDQMSKGRLVEALKMSAHYAQTKLNE